MDDSDDNGDNDDNDDDDDDNASRALCLIAVQPPFPDILFDNGHH